ncbi:MAG: YegS/Rv2252/BmrU family lipid kinase [Gammaproteobacteria bacterium]|nr:YegS/Rv2252/BmrU family lipid kinase [Gammaproteobacteria bacterium]
MRTVRKEGHDLRVLVPYNKKEKPRIVQQALDEGAERIIAGGGDGTINAVANAIVGDGSTKPDATLGICPLGTANDFARGCDLPFTDLAECLRIACTRDGREIDVGVLNGRNFVNVASAGFGAEITATTPVDLKKALGGAAYTLMGMAMALKLTPYEGRVVIPGEDPVEGSMLFMAVGNNHFAGGGFDVAPHAKLDDGLLDLTAIRADRGVKLIGIDKEIEDPMNPDNKLLFYRQLPEFTIESEKKLQCNLDGEPIQKKKLRFSIRSRHLRVAY